MAYCRDEELAEKVNQFLVLYDMIKLIHIFTAWQKVADDLEFENGEC